MILLLRPLAELGLAIFFGVASIDEASPLFRIDIIVAPVAHPMQLGAKPQHPHMST